ncbi:phage tail tape measure protein [Nocardioides lacusdianchii]|uniref:phage tail tape measure protein n=1 Tax=Nocardioides lacusdianchii TaxID=2783664 RepID=UPI001CCB2CA6|nr:phage tail tape measure protein [Nocardioides lacusdianchii]
MSETRSVVVRLSMEASNYISEAQKAGKVGEDAMRRVERSTVSADQALDRIGGQAGRASLALSVGLGAAITKTANFDQAMSSVQAATRETEAGMKSLREAALEAGAETAFSATEAAAGIENLAKAGVSTKDILDGGLTGALDLAAAGGLEVADAAEAAAGALAQFKLDGDQATHVADLLAAGAGKAQGDVSDMVLALKQAGTVSAQTGLSLEETVGALSAMAEQSLLGSDAGTSFKTMLAALTPNSKAAADAMDAYNISAFDAQGNFVGMTALAGQLRDGLSGLTDEQRAMALETIFGSDAVRAASIIYDNGAEGIANWTSQVNDAGFAAETAETKLDNLKGDLEELGGAFETALIGTGSGSQGFLRGLTQGLTSAINAYNELPSSAQTATSVIMGGAALIGGSIWVGSKLVRGIADTREALDSLEASGSKATGVMKGLAAAGAGLAVLLVAAEGIKAIQRATDEALPGVETLEGRLIDMANLPDGFSGRIGEEFDSIGDSIDRIADPGRADEISDTLQTPFEGLFGEASSLRAAKAEIDSLDEALAGLVSSGNADLAGDALATIAEQYDLTEGQVKSLTSLLPGYNDALAAQANDAELAAQADAELAAATEGVGSAMAGAEPLTKGQADALKEARKAANDTAREFFNLGDGLDDSTVSLNEWIAQMASQADALRNFRLNAEKAADKGLRKGLIAALEDAGPAGALRMRQLANATETEIRKANRAWQRGQDEINKYVDATTKVPREVSTTVKVNKEAAAQAITSINAQLAAIDRNIVVNVSVRRGGGGELPYLSGAPGATRKAGGGLLRGPGTGTSDDIPILASNGEYVVKAAAVQKYGVHMFDGYNAMRYATGGQVERKRSRTAFSVVDNSDSLQAAIDRLTGVAENQTAAVDAQRAALEDATEATDMWASKMADAGRNTLSNFGLDLFSSSSNPWAEGAGGGALSNLTNANAGLTERIDLQAQLGDLGLTGDALSQLLTGTNEDIAGMIQRGEIGQYAALYSQYQSLSSTAAGGAGQLAFGSEYAQAQAVQQQEFVELQAQTASLKALEAQIGSLAAAQERTASQVEELNEEGPARTGVAAGREAALAVRGWGNEAARRTRGEWSTQ